MRNILLIIVFSVFLSACGDSASHHTSNSANVERYDVRGTVVSVDKANKKVELDHEEIEGFMEKMTMKFPVHDDWVWDEMTPGSEIRATLVVDNQAKDPYWLENIGIIAAQDPNKPAPPINDNFAQLGKEVPAFSLTNQDGKKFTFNDYRGKAVAVTFIYRECPLPEYCIKMSRQFSDIALQLKDDQNAKDNIRLISVSFDPARDNPDKLKQYGLGYLGKGNEDFTIWQLAVGSDKEIKDVANFFGLRYEVDENDKTQFLHSLVTAIIAPDGKVAKIFKGSDWKETQLIEELNKTLKK